VGTMLDPGPKDVPSAMMRHIARQIHVDAERLEMVLKKWSRDDYLAHCATLPASGLMPPSIARGAPGAMPATAGQSRRR